MLEALTTYAEVAAAVAAELHGATQETIERNTFPHKYRRVTAGGTRPPAPADDPTRTSSTTDASKEDDDDDCEKCPICLSKFEMECDVRYVLSEYLIKVFYWFWSLPSPLLSQGVCRVCICFTWTAWTSGCAPRSSVRTVALTSNASDKSSRRPRDELNCNLRLSGCASHIKQINVFIFIRVIILRINFRMEWWSWSSRKHVRRLWTFHYLEEQIFCCVVWQNPNKNCLQNHKTNQIPGKFAWIIKSKWAKQQKIRSLLFGFFKWLNIFHRVCRFVVCLSEGWVLLSLKYVYVFIIHADLAWPGVCARAASKVAPLLPFDKRKGHLLAQATPP